MKNKFSNALSLALIMSMFFTSVGLADNVVNNVTVGGTDTFTAPGSTTVGYRINQAAAGDPQSGCNVSDGTPATVTLSVPAGVTASATSLIFTACNATQNVNFSSSTPGNYAIIVSSVIDSGGGGYNNQANFTLHVLAPANTAPSLILPGNIVAEATSASGAVVTYSASATDVQDNPDPTPSCVPASGSTFALGSTTVNCSVTDSGSLSANGSFSVTVQDTTAPALTLPSNITAEATGSSGAAVSYVASATDLVDGSFAADCSPASGLTFALGTTPVSCSATDAAGNGASGGFNVIVQDTTAPVLALPADITAEATGPSGAAVSYSASASDLVDGPVTPACAPASGSTFALGTTSVECSATDTHSNTSNGSFNVNVVDTTAPMIAAHGDETAEATSAAGAIVSYTSPATSDAVDGAGTATCLPASGSQFALGDTTVTCNASDAAGNDADSTTFVVSVVDTTAPVIAAHADETAEATSALGAVVNYTSPATSDVVDGDGAATCVPASGSQFALGDTTVTCNASDAAGNAATSTTFVVHVVDTTDPTITLVSRLPAANSFGWNNSDVTVTWSCTDLVGVLSASVSQTVSAEGAGQSATGTCEDTSGNTADNTVSGINIDKTAPSVSLVGGPANGGSYYFGSVPAAPTCSASDALSGLASPCSVAGYSTAVGGHTVTASATDIASNTASASATYTVLAWTPNGFFQPVDMSGVWNTIKGGQTVPLKFEIFAGATELTNTSAVQSVQAYRIACAASGSEDAIETVTTGGTSLRYDATSGQFIFNWQTPRQPGTCYKVVMTAQDGSMLTAFFKLK